MDMNRTDAFLKEIRTVSETEIPEGVKERARLAVLDYLGVVFAGGKVLKDKTSVLMDSFYEEGSFYPLGVQGADHGLGLSDAAFISGLNAHALDFDDGTNAGIIHLGSPVFSSLFTMVQKHHVSEEVFIKAAVLGYEAAFTMAMTVQPMAKKRGYHATGVCGVLGAALAVSYMLGLDEKTTREAFSIASVSAGGTLKVLEDGSELKPYNVAKSSLLAVTSVQMALAGFKGPDDALGGNAGFLRQISGDEDVPQAPVLLNGTYAIQKAYIKPYAACRYCHPPIDIALMMREDPEIKKDNIDHILIKTYDLAVKKHDHTVIRGAGSAKMSIPYNFAATFLTGKTGMNTFDEAVLGSDEVLSLVKRITVEADDDMSAVFPGLTVAEVTIYGKDGRSWTKRVDLPKGEPENPLNTEEVRRKYGELMDYAGIESDTAGAAADAVLGGKDPEEVLRILGVLR